MLVAAATLAGCAGTAAPVPAVTRTRLVTVTPTPTPSASFSIPSVTNREVTRSTYVRGQITANSEAFPDEDVLSVEAACTSTENGVLRYVMQDEQGDPTGLAGSVPCDGHPTTQTLGLGTSRRPASVSLQLSTTGRVDAGYAILRRGAATDLLPGSASTPTSDPEPTVSVSPRVPTPETSGG